MTNILIVENERVTAWDLQEALEHLGYQVSGVMGSAPQAVQSVSGHPPDLVLMDIRLADGTDGITAADQIRQLYRIPVIYLTAYADAQTLKRALASQPFGYLIKPFNQAELHTTIETALARYQLEQELYNTQQWLWTTLNSIGDGAIATDSAGRIQFINSTATLWTGWSPEQAIGQPVEEIFQLLDPETRLPLPSPFAAAIAQRQHVQLETPCLLIAQDGTERYIGDSVSPILSAHAKFLGCILIFQDMTAYVLAQREMQLKAEREHVLRTLTESIRRSLDLQDVLDTTVEVVRQHLHVERVIVYQFDENLEGTVVAESVADGQLSMLGVSIADPCLTLTPCIEKYRQPYVQALDHVATSGLADCYVELLQKFDVKANLVVSIVFDHHTPWGLLVAQHCSAPRPWLDEEIALLTQLADQISVAVHQSRLYNQLKGANEALDAEIKERNLSLDQISRHEVLLHQVTQRMWQSFDEGQIIQATVHELRTSLNVVDCHVALCSSEDSTENKSSDNPALNSGFKASDASSSLEWFRLERHLYADQHCPSECYQFCTQVLNLRDEWHCVLVCPMYEQGGTLLGDLLLVRPAESSFSTRESQVVQQVAHQCAIAIGQSRLYQATQAQMDQLERLNQLKDDFLSTVSHELRTPIANIRMATQMLEITMQRLGVLDSNQSGIEQYFKILKAEGQREIRLIDDLLNLSRLEAGLEVLNPILVDLRLWVVHICDSFAETVTSQDQELLLQLPDSMPLVYADLSCLERIVSELLMNACKYTPRNEQIRISGVVHADRLDLCFTNTGVEISPNELSRIFEKFYRISHGDRWKHGGTGLGLALARKLAQRLEGDLTVESTNNETTFILTLPLSAALPPRIG
ncbi:MAG: GAF domain-containing protein [Elainellaceae cyanobacterium]